MKTKKLGRPKKEKVDEIDIESSVEETKEIESPILSFGKYDFDDCILFVVSGDNEKQITELQNTGKCVGVIRYDNPLKPSGEDKIFVVISR